MNVHYDNEQGKVIVALDAKEFGELLFALSFTSVAAGTPNNRQQAGDMRIKLIEKAALSGE